VVAVKGRKFEGLGGVALAADSFGDAANRPALLLHGGGQTRHSWAGTAGHLALAGWNAITVDLRGHGESAWCPDGRYDPRDFGADVVAIARQLDHPPVLIGASLGGIASLLAIAEAGNDIASALVLVDIATRVELEGTQRIVDFMASGRDGFESLEEVADAVAAYNPHRPRPKDVSGLEKNLRRGENGRLYWHWDPGFMTPNPEDSRFLDELLLDDAARSLEIPTLIVRGRQSDVLSQEGVDSFLELAPHAEFADVAGAGHMVAGDRNDAFSQSVIDFLARRLG